MTDTGIRARDRLWLQALAWGVIAFLVLPILIVVPMSFSAADFLQFPPEAWSLRWYESYLASPDWRLATWVSLKAAVLTMLVATPLGVAAAYGLHASGARWARAVQMALIAPLVAPVVIVAVGVFYLYVQLGMLNTTLGLVLAHSVLALPFVLVTASAGLAGADMDLERAARSLGASRATAFLTVTLPQIRGSVISGALFAFIVSLDEVVVALFISSGPQSTLTRRMFTGLRDEVDPTIAAISTLLIATSLLVLVATQLAARRR